MIERGRQIADDLGVQPADKIKATLIALACRVDVNSDRIELSLSRRRLTKMLAGQVIDLTTQGQRLDRESHDIVTLTAPARLKRVGREMRMLVDGSDDQRIADPSLRRIIARAHDIQGRLSQNPKLTVARHRARKRGDCSLPFQPPSAPLAGTRHHNGHCQRSSTAQLNAKTLMRKASRLPADWKEQRTLLGF